jgi:ABC-2 type transport system permease protein
LAVAASLNAMAADPATAGGLATANGAEAVSGGFQLGMLTIAVLGALLITGEYSTGMIRSTLAAVPTRVPVLGAKAVVLAVVTVAVASVSIALAYVATMPLLSEHDLVPALDEARTWQVFGGTVYFLVAAALFALGVGTLLRSSAAAITVALTVLLLLPGVLSFIHLDWVQRLVDYLPLPASGAFLGETGTPCRRPALGSRRRPACWSWPPTRWFHSSPVRCRCAAGTPEAFCRLSPCARVH